MDSALIPAWGAIVALTLSIVLIIKKVQPVYALIFGAFFGGIISCFDLELVVKEMTAGAKDIVPATTVAMVWVILSLLAAVMIGPAAHVYLAEPLAAGQHETVFMVLVNQMFHPIITGVLLSAILAAIMSTASAQLLVTASSLSNDLYRGLVRKNASEKEVIWVSKFTVLLVAALALYMGMDPNSSIFGIVSYAWAGLGASFGPAVFLSLYWKRMTCKGAIAGVVTGAVSTIVFNWLKLNVGGIFSVYELLPAFICAIIAIVVVSLLDKEPEKAIQDEFDKALDYAKNN